MTEVAIVDLRYLAESQPSLCIPRVFNNITETRIRQVFDDLALGKINRIDIKERKSEKGDSFKRVYVHFDKWFWNENAQAARRKLVSGKEIKIVYDNPWFWKVSASKWGSSTDLQDRTAPPQRSRARIEFDDEPRTTDEFGRDLQLKKEHFERRRDENRPDNRKYNNSRHHNRRPDSRRPEVPTLQRKADKPVTQENIMEKPKFRYSDIDNPDELTAKHPIKIDYGNIMPPLKKKNVSGKKVAVEIIEESKTENGDIFETADAFNNMSMEDKKACQDLYEDLER